MNHQPLYEYVGAIHMHTIYSDGTATHAQIAQTAEEAGLDFVIVTDHNVRVAEAEGRYGNVLVLIGEEVHDPQRKPESSHLLVFGVDQSLHDKAQDPQALIDAVHQAGGICFLAHPFEHSAAYSGEPDINWRDWDVTGYCGLELWNTMSEFKSHVPNLPQALFLAFFPDWGLQGPHPETLAKWDELLAAGQRVAIIGGPDAHGTIYRKGPIARPVLPYDWLFRAVRLHILLPQPLTGEVGHDAHQIYQALRAGNAFVAYDWIGDARGFRFMAHQAADEPASMGETLTLHGEVTLAIDSPLPAHLRVIRHGKVIAEGYGRRLQHKTRTPGAYRVEAYRRHRFRQRGWAFTNPIYMVEETA